MEASLTECLLSEEEMQLGPEGWKSFKNEFSLLNYHDDSTSIDSKLETESRDSKN
jgi:hypothetical protein